MELGIERGNQIKMYSWKSVEPKALRDAGEITSAFLRLGVRDLRQAARFIQLLRYGRNLHPGHPRAVLDEQIGTCSTKHALMRRFAAEQNVTMALTIGMYEMSERNTPGVGVVLKQFQLRSLPEAHCFIRVNGKRIDLTGISALTEREPITHFLYETDIEPDQVLSYKASLHKRFLRSWIDQQSRRQDTVEELWSIREQCIAALSKRLEPYQPANC